MRLKRTSPLWRVFAWRGFATNNPPYTRFCTPWCQRHRRDLDSLRGFKIFFHLTDVDEDGGPHVFVKASHRSRLLSTGRALTDAQVEAAFGTAGTVTMTGPAGSRFLGDTYGVHKGALPRRGRRLLLSGQYNVNRTPHGPTVPPLDRRSPLAGRTGRAGPVREPDLPGTLKRAMWRPETVKPLQYMFDAAA